ncbi:MAG TPA: helix-turn-helix domain-containing protein [Gammaproteobacteria bacterium]|nr:helix-turn-helix domain-containing protein [Gammaproteobacteria bacterium]
MAASKPKVLLDQKAAAHILDKSVAWMERARWAGNGPPYFKIGRAVRYEEDALYAWIAEHSFTSTAQYSEDHKPNACTPAHTRPAATFVQVDEDYALGTDSISYHVLQRKSSKDNYRWEPIAWYATVEPSNASMHLWIGRYARAAHKA